LPSHYWVNKPPMGSYPDITHPLCPTWGYLFNERTGRTINDIVRKNNGEAFDRPTDFNWLKENYQFNATHDDDSRILFSTANGNQLPSVPFSVFARWTVNRLTSTGNAIWSISRSSVSSNQHALIVGGGDVPSNNKCSAMSRNTGWVDAEGTVSIAAKEWHTCCGVWHTSTDRRIYTDGADEVIETSSSSPDNLDRMFICGLSDSTENWEIDGVLEYLFIYDWGLTATDILQIHEDPYAWVTPPITLPDYFMDIVAPPTGSGAISLAGEGGLAGMGGLAGPHGGLVG